MKTLVGAFNQEKALVGAFSVIVKTDCETDGSFYSTTKDKSMYQLEMLFAKLPDVCDESCIRRRREVAERFSYGLHSVSYSYCKV